MILGVLVYLISYIKIVFISKTLVIHGLVWHVTTNIKTAMSLCGTRAIDVIPFSLKGRQYGYAVVVGLDVHSAG